MDHSLHFKDKILHRCRLPCRASGHYHCPYCSRTIIRRVDMERHLVLCYNQHSVLPCATPSTESVLPCATPSTESVLPCATPSAESVLPCATPSTESVLPCATPSAESVLPCATPSAESVLPCATPSAESFLPCATPSTESGPSQDHLYALQPVQGAAEVCGKYVKCQHCNLSLLKKNYNTHLLRRHSDLSQDITQACHLQSVTVDERNVQKTGHGFSVPVHVQRKTWGKMYIVKCELEECVQFQLLARRSGFSYSLCSHIRSVDYCKETAAETFLKEDTLRDMVTFKFFGEAKAANCVKRQKDACAAHVPLCVPVDFGGSSSQICLSIHEPNIHSFCRLGRIMVTYNTQRNTWHCPCTKPRTSCPHIHISKWHLFQTQRHLLKSEVPTTPSPESCSLLDITGTKRSVQYIFKEKKIPEALPKQVTTQRMKMEYPKQFFPLKTTFQLCTAHPVLVTKKARIVGMMGLIDNISTYHRICPQCNMVYRYQEWKDFDNHIFDNHIFLTLELCVFLRENVTAVQTIPSLSIQATNAGPPGLGVKRDEVTLFLTQSSKK